MEVNKTLSTISSLSPKAELNILLDFKCMCLLAYIVQSNQQYVNSIFRKYMVALLLRIIDNLLNDDYTVQGTSRFTTWCFGMTKVNATVPWKSICPLPEFL